MQALERGLRGGGPKVQWNAAAAACRLLGNLPLATAMPGAATAATCAAAELLQSSGNLKASTQASALFCVMPRLKAMRVI